jgi:hypothetical protein
VTTLSVACITRDPPERVRAAIEPLRAIATEVVVAADSRVAADRRAAYETLADRVFDVHFSGYVGRHLEWLHGQCSGDWVLRIDGDEVASPSLIAVLPRLLAETEIEQFWLPIRWLAPNRRGWLDELPWAPDYQNRIVRRETARFSGHIDTGAEPDLPARYLREPLYHLVCALEPAEDRLVRSLGYELVEPLRLAPGGGRLNATRFLPERFARRSPARLPRADHAAVTAALAGHG